MRTSRRRLTSTTTRFIFSSRPIAGRRRESSHARVATLMSFDLARESWRTLRRARRSSVIDMLSLGSHSLLPRCLTLSQNPRALVTYFRASRTNGVARQTSDSPLPTLYSSLTFLRRRPSCAVATARSATSPLSSRPLCGASLPRSGRTSGRNGTSSTRGNRST